MRPEPIQRRASFRAVPFKRQRARRVWSWRLAWLLCLFPAILVGLPGADAEAQSIPVDGQHQTHRIKKKPLCSTVCAQNEACIDGRCVRSCSPSCREGTYCAPSGECLPRENVEQDKPTEGELIERRGAESADSRFVAAVDLGGIIFFGARPTFEWGRHHAFNVRLQMMNTGAMTYKVEQQTEFEHVEWGFGASFGYRRYEPQWGNMRGFYYGGGLSYSMVGVRDVLSTQTAIWTHYPGFYGEFGYRWVFDDFLFGFGPQLGLRVPVHSQFKSLAPGSCAETNSCSRENEARLEGVVVVEVGWFL